MGGLILNASHLLFHPAGELIFFGDQYLFGLEFNPGCHLLALSSGLLFLNVKSTGVLFLQFIELLFESGFSLLLFFGDNFNLLLEAALEPNLILKFLANFFELLFDDIGLFFGLSAQFPLFFRLALCLCLAYLFQFDSVVFFLFLAFLCLHFGQLLGLGQFLFLGPFYFGLFFDLLDVYAPDERVVRPVFFSAYIANRNEFFF